MTSFDIKKNVKEENVINKDYPDKGEISTQDTQLVENFLTKMKKEMESAPNENFEELSQVGFSTHLSLPRLDDTPMSQLPYETMDCAYTPTHMNMAGNKEDLLLFVVFKRRVSTTTKIAKDPKKGAVCIIRSKMSKFMNVL